MVASNNPFYVAPPDVMQSLMAFDQSYNAARKDADQEQIKAARIQAGQAIQSGADPKMVLGALMKYDPATASAYGALLHQQAQEKLGQETLAETSRYHTGTLGQSAAQLAQTEKHQTAADTLAREQFETGKTQVIPDPFGGPPRVIRTGPKGYEELPVTGGTAPPAPAMTSGMPAPPNQNLTSGTVTGVDYGPVQTTGGGPAAPVSPVRVQQPPLSNIDALKERYGKYPGAENWNWNALNSIPEKARENVIKMVIHDTNPIAAFPNRNMPGQGESVRSAYITAANNFDPKYNMQDYPLIQNARNAFNPEGVGGKSISAFNTAFDHLSTLREYAQAMANGDNQLVNSIRNRWREKAGSELPTNYKALAPVVTGEVAKAAIGSNNALTDRQELRDPLNASGSWAQISGAIGGYQQLIGGKMNSLRQDFVTTTKRPVSEFYDRLLPGVRSYLQNYDKKEETGSSAEGGQSGGVKWRIIK